MWRVLFLLFPFQAMADSLIATRTIRAQDVLAPEDVAMVAAEIPGAVTDPEAAIGLEARVTIFAGRPVLATDLGAAATVERNQIVPMLFQAGPLAILTEGRALARGGVGDIIRIMNTSSRVTVTGQIGQDGIVRISP